VRSLKGSRWQLFHPAPGALPYLFSGMKVAAIPPSPAPGG
jgi:ABC-type nitrate/sulfonate/bicarbonate transport system permease component